MSFAKVSLDLHKTLTLVLKPPSRQRHLRCLKGAPQTSSNRLLGPGLPSKFCKQFLENPVKLHNIAKPWNHVYPDFPLYIPFISIPHYPDIKARVKLSHFCWGFGLSLTNCFPVMVSSSRTCRKAWWPLMTSIVKNLGLSVIFPHWCWLECEIYCKILEVTGRQDRTSSTLFGLTGFWPWEFQKQVGTARAWHMMPKWSCPCSQTPHHWSKTRSRDSNHIFREDICAEIARESDLNKS